ncbi:MAG: fasciclin domain-containing protein [Planctomycetota bacterium]|nr:MAG: fasciclin domain-containing protein [Planctomycetota bacterium]
MKLAYSFAIALGLGLPAPAPANAQCSGSGSANNDRTAAAKPAKLDIVDTAQKAGAFKTLLAAAQAAGLVDTLKSEGPFTVFAPTDEAFAALPEGTMESLLFPENKDKLVAILTYHVVPGRVLAKDVVKLDRATTVEGSDIRIETQEGSVRINDATVVQADIMTSNGVIHVINRVILPPTKG